MRADELRINRMMQASEQYQDAYQNYAKAWQQPQPSLADQHSELLNAAQSLLRTHLHY